MDNQNQNITQPTTPTTETPVVVASESPTITPTSAPVAEPATPSNPPKKNNMILFLVLAIIIVVAIVLAVMITRSNGGVKTKTAPVSQQVQQPTITQAPVQQTAVTPAAINSAQDVNNALQQVDSTNPASVGASLNQNATDASQFSR